MSKNQVLVLILVFSAALTLFGLSRGDTVNDEVFMSFRGLGMMDFDEAEAQTTPLEWFDPDIPAWTRLSFHDHPPLVFAAQNIFMRVFGENNFAFRLPSALLGIASIYLLYLLGSHLYSANVGLISAALFGATLNHIYISRVGMQEAYVIFFLLLASYVFLKSLKKDSYLPWLGIILGLAFLTKYNSFILVPIFITYLAFFKREYFLNKKLWLGALFALIIFSPVLIYNAMLYRAVGHFDFQFSYIFGQNPEVWKVAPGKEIGSLADRIAVFVPRLIATNSWLFLSLTALSLIAFVVSLFKNFKLTIQKHFLLLVVSCWLLVLLLIIGPSYRFLTMLTPFFALSIGIFISIFGKSDVPRGSASPRFNFPNIEVNSCQEVEPRKVNKFISIWRGRTSKIFGHPMSRNYRNIRTSDVPILGSPTSITSDFHILIRLAVILIILFEIFYSINNQIAYYPKGPTPWLSSKVRYENYNWGYNELGEFLKQELKGKMPALTFDLRYQFLENLREKAVKQGLAKELEPYPALIAYYGNFDKAAKLWVLDRLHIYHGWPIISLETYFGYLRENGFDYYDRVGFKHYYFILQSNIVPPEAAKTLMHGAEIPIYNKRGDEVFRIYKF